MSSVISVLMGDANMVTEEVIKPHRVAGEGQKQPGRFVDTSFFQQAAGYGNSVTLSQLFTSIIDEGM
jgi:hypothetical protein